MKKLTLLLVFASLVFFGCNKQESNPELNDQQFKQSLPDSWVLNMDAENYTWEPTPFDAQVNNPVPNTLKGGNSVHTHGDFSFSAISISWSGTVNNGGSHGEATFQQTFTSLPFPPFTPFDPPVTTMITMETECLMDDGNEVVYGGVFTEVLNSPFPGGGPFAVGNHLYFKVIDNGQGSNAPADQFSTFLAISPVSRCDVYTPDNPLWTLFGPYQDVMDPGSVKLNN